MMALAVCGVHCSLSILNSKFWFSLYVYIDKINVKRRPGESYKWQIKKKPKQREHF